MQKITVRLDTEVVDKIRKLNQTPYAFIQKAVDEKLTCSQLENVFNSFLEESKKRELVYIFTLEKVAMQFENVVKNINEREDKNLERLASISEHLKNIASAINTLNQKVKN